LESKERVRLLSYVERQARRELFHLEVMRRERLRIIWFELDQHLLLKVLEVRLASFLIHGAIASLGRAPGRWF
jgi:hypothetical protein